MQSWKGQDIREIVADAEWQVLRESFIGTWKNQADQNVLKLKNYLGENPDEMKLVRVYNYLTGSGFRLGVIGNENTNSLKKWVYEKLNPVRS